MFSQPPRTLKSRAAWNRAFTLIEVMMVVLIVGIIAAVVIPSVINTSDLQAMSAARMVATDLQYAQDAAITSQTPVTVTFDPSRESYYLSNASGTLVHPITKGVYVTDFRSLGGFAAVDVASVTFAGASAVTFDEVGTPSAAGTVAVQAGPHVYTVAVAAVTGRVTASGS